jgi:hypothetical protein
LLTAEHALPANNNAMKNASLLTRGFLFVRFRLQRK